MVNVLNPYSETGEHVDQDHDHDGHIQAHAHDNDHDHDLIGSVGDPTVLKYGDPVILLVGVFGNVMVFVVLNRMKKRFYAFDIFFMALVTSNTMILLLTALPRWVETVSGFGIRASDDHLFCHVNGWIDDSAWMVSSNLLTAMTVQRAIGVVYPHKVNTEHEIRASYGVIAGIIFTSFVMRLQYFLDIVKKEGDCFFGNKSRVNHTKHGNRWALVNFFSIFMFPFVIIIASNGVLLNELNKSRIRARRELSDIEKNDDVGKASNFCRSGLIQNRPVGRHGFQASTSLAGIGEESNNCSQLPSQEFRFESAQKDEFNTQNVNQNSVKAESINSVTVPIKNTTSKSLCPQTASTASVSFNIKDDQQHHEEIRPCPAETGSSQNFHSLGSGTKFHSVRRIRVLRRSMSPSTLTLTVMSTSLVFCLLVSPWFLLEILASFHAISHHDVPPIAIALLHQLLLCSASVNFYLYCLTGSKVRKQMRVMFCRRLFPHGNMQSGMHSRSSFSTSFKNMVPYTKRSKKNNARAATTVGISRNEVVSTVEHDFPRSATIPPKSVRSSAVDMDVVAKQAARSQVTEKQVRELVPVGPARLIQHDAFHPDSKDQEGLSTGLTHVICSDGSDVSGHPVRKSVTSTDGSEDGSVVNVFSIDLL